MYCKKCGADEPDIKINNKSYCSNCGLPIGDDAPVPEIEDSEPENKAVDEAKAPELSNVFSELKNALDSDTGGSYRSKDITLNKRKEEEKLTDKIQVQPEAAAEVPILEKPLQKEIEDVLNILPPTEETKQESEPVETVNNIDNANKDEGDLAQDIASTLEVNEKQPNKENELSKQTELPTDKASKEDPTRTLDEEDLKKNIQDPKLDSAVKKVDELGTANRLLDILEEQEKEEDLKEKIKQNKKIGDSFSKLIDILNQPIKSPEPKKHQPNDKIEKPTDPITESLNSLNETKEIESPLEKPELEAGKTESPETIAQDDTWPIFREEPTVKKEKKKLFKAKKKAKEKKVDDREANEEKPSPLVSEINEILKDVEANDAPSLPPVKPTELPEIPDIKQEEKKIDPGLPNNKNAAEKEEIHGLGDKKGHVDDWPEEEVVSFTAAQAPSPQHHVISEFMKSIVPEKKSDQKKKEKTKLKKVAKKNKKSSLTKSNAFKIIIAFITTIIIFGSIIIILNTFSSQQPKVTPAVTPTTTFDILMPTLPAEYKEKRRVINDSNSVLIEYVNYSDDEKFITMKQEVGNYENDLEVYASKNSSTYNIVSDENKVYYVLDDKKIIWIENDIFITLEKSESLGLGELKIIADSI